MWQLGAAENHAVLTGAKKRMDAERVMHLYGAWHVAAWNTAAKVGKLKGWPEYHRELTGTTAPVVPMDWRTRKAERKRQMDLLQKKQAQRTRPPRRRT